ncbi:MAG TPA: glycosyltransferase family 2 protein [Verrucomicrobiae bacterium]|nr:glycosyltransferase family 2 protein [Verrucomicrobiae bacterium]
MNAEASSPIVGGISVVVPVYNAEATLRDLIGELEPVLRAIGGPFEAVLVNDGSRDGSWAVIGELAAAWPWVRGIDLTMNYGQHNALLCGIREARHDTIVTMDDDLQHRADEIPLLLAELEKDFDVVYGYTETLAHDPLRSAAAALTKLILQQFMGARAARRVSSFRAFRSHLRDGWAAFHGPYVSIDVLLSWTTRRFGAVPTHHRSRERGRSNYTLLKLFDHAMNMFTGFSVLPLRIASLIGFAVCALGLIMLVFVLARFLIEGREVPGFAFLASAISIFSGVQLFALGMIGEYLGRMYFRVAGKPTFSVRGRVG